MVNSSQDVNARALRVLVANTQGVEELNRVYKVLTTEGMAKYTDMTSGQRMSALIEQWNRLKEAVSANSMTGIAPAMEAVFKSFADVSQANIVLTQAYQKTGDAAWLAGMKANAFNISNSFMGKTAEEVLAAAMKEAKGLEAIADAGKKVEDQAKKTAAARVQVGEVIR